MLQRLQPPLRRPSSAPPQREQLWGGVKASCCTGLVHLLLASFLACLPPFCVLTCPRSMLADLTLTCRLQSACGLPCLECAEQAPPLRPPRCRHLAAEMGHVACLHKILAVAPTATQLINCTERTPAHLAAINGHTAALDAILTVDPSAAAYQDMRGQTPLHEAAVRGHTAAVERLLVACPAAASARRQDNASALYLAAENGHEEVVSLLLDAAPGEALGVADGIGNGPTPAHIAADNNHAGILLRILKATPQASQAPDLKAS